MQSYSFEVKLYKKSCKEKFFYELSPEFHLRKKNAPMSQFLWLMGAFWAYLGFTYLR